jgi:octaprenyl-diphosphate synthase
MMVGLRNMRVMEVLSDATNLIAEGEVLQLLNARNADISEAQYLEVIQRKTARLFEAAAQLGAIQAGAAAAMEQALAAYGMHLGTAFQLIDDVLDYSGDLEVIGKNLGDDLREGKATLPLIHVMRHGQPNQAELVRQAIIGSAEPDFLRVREAILATGALDYARDCARNEARLAAQAIEVLPPSPYRQCMLDLARFAVERDY